MGPYDMSSSPVSDANMQSIIAKVRNNYHLLSFSGTFLQPLNVAAKQGTTFQWLNIG